MIIYFLVLTVSFFLLALFLKYFRSHFHKLAENSLRLVDSLLLKIDEEEKLKLVQKQNNLLILALLKVAIIAITAVLIGSIPIYLYLVFSDVSYSEISFTSIEAIIAISIGSTLGFLLPINKTKTEGYSELSQLLHRLVLNNYAIAYQLFKLELKRLTKNTKTVERPFLIVSGLARAGTTSLMNKLTESNHYTSLNYGNMPFITSPNIWKKLYAPKGGKQKERSHKDGIQIGLSSNEALEEYFFKMLSNDSYVKEDYLKLYNVSKEDYDEYMNYQNVVLNNNKKIYLAKNNNFALRYQSFREHDKEFIIVFMFRDPVSHAASLLEKHKEFSKLQKEDEFVLEYMNWLGHHEFGTNQKPFQFTEITPKYLSDKLSIDYWLQIWINYYNYLLSIDKSNALFVDYSDYCIYPNKTLNSIQKKIDLTESFSDLIPYHNKRTVDYNCSEELKEQAYSIFNQLKSLKLSST